jgi:putative phosphoserine phosphatase/1-acylglycerol-3-phosphate O-acyltransferase
MDVMSPDPVPRRAAAFFDLDRTLVGDSSGLILVEALVEAGLLRERDKTIANLTRRAYKVIGETWFGMQITRRSISRIAGWSVEQLRDAARRAVDLFDQAVYSEARALIERHRSEGRLVVIATSTGREIVEPLAERLGVDHLIATEYEHEDGRLTGRFLGRWLWGPDKAAAIKEWADRNAVDLGESYAYSDSFYDRPMLEMVGYPRPVNPDPLLRAFAVRKGWPVLRFSHRGPVLPFDLYDVLRPLMHPLLLPFDLDLQGVEAIPAAGPCIVAANHRSYADPLVLSAVASRRGRKLRYLGKKEVFDAPVVGQVARALGQIRVDRGTGSAKPLREATEALERGEAIGIFPQGTIPRGETFFESRLRGRTGVARMAVATGAPVIPVAIWDTEKMWPRSSRVPLPSVGKRKVHARVGEAITLKAAPGDEDSSPVLHALTQQVMDAICDLLPDEVRNPPAPTAGQIKAASPP